MKRVYALFAALAIAAIVFAQTRPAEAALELQHQINAVIVEVDVGSGGAIPTPGPGGSAGGSQPIAANILPPKTAFHMMLSSRYVRLSTTAGQTVESGCDVNVGIVGEPSAPSINAYTVQFYSPNASFASGTSSFPVSGNFFGLTQKSGWFPFRNTASAVNVLTALNGNQTYCAKLRVKVPKGTKAGRYFAQVDLIYLDKQAGQGSVATASPSPSPTSSTTPTPTPTTTPFPGCPDLRRSHKFAQLGKQRRPHDGGSLLFASTGLDANHSIYAFDLSATGNVAPLYSVSSACPLLSDTTDVVTDSSGNFYVSSYGEQDVLVFPPTAQGATQPFAQITGSNTMVSVPISMGFDAANNLYVLSGSGQTIEEFPPGASGNVTPTAVIPPSATTLLDDPKGIGVSANGTLYVADIGINAVLVFAPGASGGGTIPIGEIDGKTAQIGSPYAVSVDGNGNIYVLTNDNMTDPSFFNNLPAVNPRILEFPANTTTGVAPSAVIEGPATGLNTPSMLHVDAAGGIYVSDWGAGAIYYFAPGSNGNVAPTRTLAGSNTPFAPQINSPSNTANVGAYTFGI
jgi:sugar lactone lactonase YvrE